VRYRLQSASMCGVEESADIEKAQANIPEPTGEAFDSYLGPGRLVPIEGQIKLVSAKVGDPDRSSYEQARAIYDYVIATMTYDKSGNGWGRGDAIFAETSKRATAPTSIRCSSRSRA